MLECGLAAGLSAHGIETHLLGQYGPGQYSGKEYAVRWKEQGVREVHWLKGGGLGYFSAIFRLARLIRKNEFSTVISHNRGQDIVVALAAKFVKFNHVVAFHYSKLSTAGWSFRLWKKLLKTSGGFYAISDYARKDVLKNLELNEIPSRVIYNALLPSQEEAGYDLRSENGIPENGRIILSVGRMHPNKGFDLCVDYLSELLQQEHTYLFLVGPDSLDREFKSELLDRISSSGLSSKIRVLNFIPGISSVYKQADIYLHLARFEGFGLVLIEAIRAGIPIVASNVGGIPEVMTGTPYKTFEISDREGIVEEVNSYLQMSADDREQRTASARAVLDRYTEDRRTGEILDFIKETESN